MKNKDTATEKNGQTRLSHGAGILLGVIAGYFLLVKATENAEPQWAVACISVYLTGMLSSYISSTWYHGTRPGKTKELLRKFDHGAIYLHIAAHTTPFTLLVLRQARRLGVGYFRLRLAVGYRRFHFEFQKAERTQ